MVLVLVACTAQQDEGPLDPPPASAPAPSLSASEPAASSPSAVASPQPERPRPTCAPTSRDQVRQLDRLVGDEAVSVAQVSTVRLTPVLRRQGYTDLAGVVLAGPGVDGVAAVLALGPTAQPLPVDELAEQVFTDAAAAKDEQLRGYRRELASSEVATDALVCAAALR